MPKEQLENLLRRQALVSEDRNRRITYAQRVADIGFFARDAGRQLNGFRIGLKRDAQAVLVAADEEVGLHRRCLRYHGREGDRFNSLWTGRAVMTKRIR